MIVESFLNVPEEVTTDLTEKGWENFVPAKQVKLNSFKFTDDHVQHIVHAIAVLNSTNTGTTSKSVLTELNELSQYNGVQYDFVIVGEEVSTAVYGLGLILCTCWFVCRVQHTIKYSKYS